MSEGSHGSSTRGLMIVLAYLWPLAVVPLMLEREDPELQWHARHGLLLMAAEVLLAGGYLVVASVVHAAAIGLGGFLLVLLVFGWSAVLAVHIAAIVKGLDGRRLVMPILSRYADGP